MAFLFPEGQSLSSLLDRLEQNGWRGQIVGPHGSGKSSLLAAMIAALETAGRSVRLVALHDGQRKPPENLFQPPLPPGGLLIIDGYEQLARWERIKLRRYCTRQELGLLVTSHRSLGLPEIFRTAPTLPTAERIVTELQQGYPAYITAQDVAAAYGRHRADLRELLFDLYDLYRQRKFLAPPRENSY